LHSAYGSLIFLILAQKSSLFSWDDTAHHLLGVHILQGTKKTFTNWDILGIDFSWPLAFSAAHYV